jgi:hypothetical protein
MPNTGNTNNPTSTVTVFDKELSFGASPNELRFTLAANGSISFPIDIATRPLRLSVVTNDATNAIYGNIQVFGTGTAQCNVQGNGIAMGSPTASQLGFTLVSGVITFTAGSSWSGTVTVNRI